jgi:NhaA family Na+:H+ antiporter
MVGVSGVAGIGFTVSLFIVGLAFPDEARQSTAKLAVLVASAVAAVLGSAFLWTASRPGSEEASASGTVTHS